jgi:hypothetical protein
VCVREDNGEWSVPSDEKSTPRTICLARSRIKGLGGKRATSCTVKARAVLLGEKFIENTDSKSFTRHLSHFYNFRTLGRAVRIRKGGVAHSPKRKDHPPSENSRARYSGPTFFCVSSIRDLGRKLC